ncbi:MAG TPA: glycosyltransferase family 4 protein [Bacillota bacterium]|nr:glycosyltransferase family 4 protein [Bacillota bacterium]
MSITKEGKKMADTVLHIVLNSFTNDSRVLRECRTLTAAGYQVHVFSLHETGLPLKETRDTHELTRFALRTRSLPKSFFWQLFKYLECVWKMVQKGRLLRPVLVHAHDRDALPIGYMIAKLARSKLVYDAHELWGHTAHAAKRPANVKKLAAKMERFIARRAAGVITVTQPIAQYMEESFGIEGVVLLRNLPYYRAREEFSRDASPLRRDLGIAPDKIILLYQGVISPHRGLELMVKATRYLRDEFVIVILGNGILVPHLKELAADLGVAARVYFHPAVSPSDLAPYTAGGDIGISIIEDVCLSYHYCLPNKVFEYMQAGLPVVVSNLPEMRKVVEEYKVGLVLASWDPELIANELNVFLEKDLYRIYSENTGKAASLFCWEREEGKLIDLYVNILADR